MEGKGKLEKMSKGIKSVGRKVAFGATIATMGIMGVGCAGEQVPAAEDSKPVAEREIGRRVKMPSAEELESFRNFPDGTPRPFGEYTRLLSEWRSKNPFTPEELQKFKEEDEKSKEQGLPLP